jgi:acetoin:2,6-dichlorophenolindophenol oxidoreductase subunit alpha
MSAITREELIRVYNTVTLARKADDKVEFLLMSGSAMIARMSSRGSETLGAVIGSVLRSEDQLVTYYRGMPEQLAKGVPLDKLWAEVMGKATGNTGGKGGWVHIIEPDVGVMVNSGIIGGQLPIAVGLALASDLRSDGRVIAVTFGDGAINQGAFHESMNLAALWKLPIVFICENNGYAEHSAYSVECSAKYPADRAAAYGPMPSARVDGDDVPATWMALSEAIDRARSGGGPTFVEAACYRHRGHFGNDPMPYIPKEEVASKIAADPVPRFRAWLLESGNATENELAAADQQADEIVEKSWSFAASSPLPEMSKLYSDVYATTGS